LDSLELTALKATPDPVSLGDVDLPSLARRKPPQKALHLNVRVTGSDVEIFEHLRNRTPNITDSLRVRDSVRIAVFLQAMRDKGMTVTFVDDDGNKADLLEYLGVFYPEGSNKPRGRPKKTAPKAG
jgi:hypothetical protein